jgi:hypothetical protein
MPPAASDRGIPHEQRYVGFQELLGEYFGFQEHLGYAIKCESHAVHSGGRTLGRFPEGGVRFQ